jgi:outer membrane protein TolC
MGNEDPKGKLVFAISATIAFILQMIGTIRYFELRGLVLAACALFLCLAPVFRPYPVEARQQLSLEQVIELAEKNSLSVEAARHDSLAAAYRYRAAAALRYPVLSMNAKSFYINELQSVDMPLGSLEIGSRENYQTDANLSVPLFTGGSITSRIRMRESDVTVEGLRLRAERLRIAHASRRAYFELLNATSSVKATRASLERVQLIERDVRNLHGQGLADSLDILETRLAFEEAQQRLDETQTRRINAAAELARLVGYRSGEGIEIVEVLPPPAYSVTDTLEVTREMIDRPELRIVEERIRIAERAVTLERSKFFPTVSAYAGYSAGKPNRDLFNKTWNDYFSVGLSLQWDFNLRGQEYQEMQGLRHSAAAARMTKRDLEDSIVLRARIARTNLQQAYRSFETAQNKYDIAKRKFRLATERRTYGQLSVNRYLELEAELAATEEQYRASVSSYYIAETEYLYAIGSPAIFGGP